MPTIIRPHIFPMVIFNFGTTFFELTCLNWVAQMLGTIKSTKIYSDKIKIMKKINPVNNQISSKTNLTMWSYVGNTAK